MATSGMAGVYRSDGASRGETGPGLFWRGLMRHGRPGRLRLGVPWPGLESFGSVWHGSNCYVLERQACTGPGLFWRDMARSDDTRQARRILAGSGAMRPGLIGHGLTRTGNTTQGRPGPAGTGLAWRDGFWFGHARPGNTTQAWSGSFWSNLAGSDLIWKVPARMGNATQRRHGKGGDKWLTTESAHGAGALMSSSTR